MLRTTTALSLIFVIAGCNTELVTSASGIPNEEIEATIKVVSDGETTVAFAEFNLDDETDAYRLLELDTDDRVELKVGEKTMPLHHRRDWNVSHYDLKIDEAPAGIEAVVAVIRGDEGDAPLNVVEIPPAFDLTYPTETKVIELPMEDDTKVMWTAIDRSKDVEIRIEGDCIYPISEMVEDNGRFDGIILQPRTTHETGVCDVNVSVVRHSVGVADKSLARDSTIVAEQIRTVTIRAEFTDALRGL